MKLQVKRLSPHQNGKVFGVLTAAISLVLFIPAALISLIFVPGGARSAALFILAPLFYLVVGYLTTLIACWFYNRLFKHVGGIEFESVEVR